MKFSCFPILAIFFCALTGCAGVPAPASTCPWDGQKTIIKDEAEARLLFDPTRLSNQLDGTIPRGQHALGQGDVLADPARSPNHPPGFVLFSNTGPETPGCPPAPYRVMGWHEYPWDDRETVQSVNTGLISGIITEIRPYEFDFNGTLSGTYGEKFLRSGDYAFTNGFYQLDGTYTFSRKDHPAYWSLVSIFDKDGDAQDYLPPLDIMTISPAKTLLEEYQKQEAEGTL
ncbi:MAG: hypothetical protein H6858_01880 [Rhodospirillales bacterium]|nr:hypothetical protein [Rhodospirillales bacterium]